MWPGAVRTQVIHDFATAQSGATSENLRLFGFEPEKPRKPLSAEKLVIKNVKAKQTREERGTLGSNQKKSVHAATPSAVTINENGEAQAVTPPPPGRRHDRDPVARSGEPGGDSGLPCPPCAQDDLALDSGPWAKTLEASFGRAAFLSISFLSLFLEVLLIRWCGAEIRILAYLRNLTLLGCFLGLGLGYAASSRRRLGLGFTFATVALLVGLAPYFKGLSSLLNFADLMSWLKGSKDDAVHFILGLLLLCGLYALLAFSFVPLGQALGAHFASVPSERRIREYTWNVLASLAGVAAFGALSFVSAPPLDWFAIATLAALLGSRTNKERASVFLLGALAIFFLIQGEKTPHLEGDVGTWRGGRSRSSRPAGRPTRRSSSSRNPMSSSDRFKSKTAPPSSPGTTTRLT